MADLTIIPLFLSFGCFLTNYHVTRVDRKIAEFLGINSSVQKRAQNRKKTLVETTKLALKFIQGSSLTAFLLPAK